MKFPLHLLMCDWSLVVGAMEEYKKNLNGYELKMFEIAHQNVYNDKEHDGMSFKYIIVALKESGLDDLVLWVEHAFKRHQKINGPRLKGGEFKWENMLKLQDAFK
ncbi:hypothetical protein [Fictibacillus sp. JL2B1089]|uniref:hypothetical protein n=1 Tax=Fictibacillus sp. JL2B1089 TaxID=3399565 RepID=UPI003A8BF18D